MSKCPTYFLKSFRSGKAQFKQTQITPAHTAVTTTAVLVFAHLRRILLFPGAEAEGLEEGEIAPSEHTCTHFSKHCDRGNTLFPKKTSVFM